MKISNKLSDQERSYIMNLIQSGAGEVRENNKFSDKATHELIVENTFIVEAKKIIRKDNHGTI